MRKSNTVQGIDLKINKPNAKLTGSQKLIKVLTNLGQTPNQIFIEKGKHDLPVIEMPYHQIRLQLNKKLNRNQFCKKIKLSKYHVHLDESGYLITVVI